MSPNSSLDTHLSPVSSVIIAHVDKSNAVSVSALQSQADHFRYHWNGESVDFIKQLSGDRVILELV